VHRVPPAFGTPHVGVPPTHCASRHSFGDARVHAVPGGAIVPHAVPEHCASTHSGNAVAGVQDVPVGCAGPSCLHAPTLQTAWKQSPGVVSVHGVPELNVHVALQHEADVPFALPASHCSVPSTIPLPHTAVCALAVDASDRTTASNVCRRSFWESVDCHAGRAPNRMGDAIDQLCDKVDDGIEHLKKLGHELGRG